MVDIAEPRAPVRRRVAVYPSVWVPLGIFAGSRVVGALILVWLSAEQAARVGTPLMHVVDPAPAHPGYFEMLTNWDGQWYQDVVENGYPRDLPRVDGEVAQSTWAFYPLFPLLVRAVMLLTAAPFAVAASVVSTACAAAAVVVVHRLLVPRVGPFNAAMAVVALSLSPAGILLQAAYTEGLALLLVVVCLWALCARRYGALALAVVLLSLARPVVLPVALLIALHGLRRWRRRDVEPFPGAERRRCALAVVAAVASFGLWPLVCAVVTGEPSGFLQTQHAWISTNATVSSSAATVVTDPLSPPALMAVVATLVGVAVVARPGARVWGADLRWWVVLYGGYLLVTASPVPSGLRYALLTVVPWWPLTDDQLTRSRTRRFVVAGLAVAFGVVGQIAWARFFYVLGPNQVKFP